MEASVGYAAAFDRLFARGREAVLAGRHYRDTPPVEGGRWGVSVVFPPDPASTARLAAVTAEAVSVAGDGHWPTGAPEAVHVTVRGLQAHRAAVPENDPFVARCAAAMARAARRSRAVRLRLAGLTLTPSGVMACGHPVDAAADEFAARLGEELRGDASFEADFRRDIWYATLVHFAGPIADPAALVDWVAARRDLDLGETLIEEAALLRFRYNGRQAVRVPLTVAPLRRE